MPIQGKDVKPIFYGAYWTMKYFWKDGQEPVLKNNFRLYDKAMPCERSQRFDKEVEKWIKKGILVRWEGEVEGVIPMMSVGQPSKNKARPVLDFRELNENVECQTRME